VPMLWKRLLAPITIPMPIAKAMAPTTIRTKNRTWASRPRGFKKLRTNSHYQNRKRDQRGEDHDVWRIAGGIGHGVIRRTWSIQFNELRLLLRPNQFGSDPAIVRASESMLYSFNNGTNQVDGARGSRCLAIGLAA
jgi:hypothetical protein